MRADSTDVDGRERDVIVVMIDNLSKS